MINSKEKIWIWTPDSKVKLWELHQNLSVDEYHIFISDILITKSNRAKYIYYNKIIYIFSKVEYYLSPSCQTSVKIFNNLIRHWKDAAASKLKFHISEFNNTPNLYLDHSILDYRHFLQRGYQVIKRQIEFSVWLLVGRMDPGVRVELISSLHTQSLTSRAYNRRVCLWVPLGKQATVEKLSE